VIRKSRPNCFRDTKLLEHLRGAGIDARANPLERLEDGTSHAQLRSPPVDGKADAELVALVAERFGCRKADVEIRDQ
jgi:hypothetical protein